ncbi:MAG TPA: pantetheine-phosphate adenylyltransferase [Spirochaetota bacterium]|nr:pantetheine-phosphate adenylyltransferase [Spirochaetota bacterium]HOH37420.1 pantetheine-phosphate adenylyltransferase [Spirochaetota bacterium]HPA64074.1 pantetheine-phosphate adenylyltransferase [Spirochaetota bacterium]HPJ15027.1 pantetheine-phosphate adenylyltransferase [Spirochaetota bacterium]HPM35445.1 pantetheine-phosphate adenylyltransferase [Spirochaetota bacterium]
MITGIYPGTFDPLTNGHMDIIRRGLRLCDRLIIAVAVNLLKKPLFSVEERLEMISDSCKDLGNIEAVSFNGLLVDYCKENGVNFIIRGVRDSADFGYERSMALMNRRLPGALETVFMVSDGESHFLSSSMIREIAFLGGDVSAFLPSNVLPFLNRKTNRA